MKKQALITGGAGFIGMHAAQRFLKKGWQVTIIDNLARPGTQNNLDTLKKEGPINFLKGDIRDAKLWPKAWRACQHRPNLIIHLAAQVAVTTSIKNPELDFDINLSSTIKMLEFIRQLPNKARPEMFILSSTNKVYGNLLDLPLKAADKRYVFANGTNAVNEGQPLDFHSPYGCSKGGADQYASDYFRSHGVPTAVLRQSCIYGTNQFGLEDQGWVAHFGIRAFLGQPITIYGNGKQVRDLLYIDDLVRLFERVYEKRSIAAGRAYNVGGGIDNTLSLLELLDYLGKYLKHPIARRFSAWREGDQKIFIADTSKAQKELGWQPQVKLADGLSLMLDWIKQNLPMIKKHIDLKK